MTELYRLRIACSLDCRCDTCGGRLDMRDRHVTVVRQVETHDGRAVTVIACDRMATMHPRCAHLTPSRREDDVCDTCGYRIHGGERYVVAAALVLEADERAGEVAVLDYTTLAAMHPRCERMHRARRW